ncbi:phage major capsid protein [Sporohalobacter salinus]|uniref:phage major capsid protein n=1 Tax=Sporohalobacter salinus TaxID=1494606 RepID=UPI0019618CDE|nr:phage major capsid protein [Sporohalobacter salinus]MBM7623724.1 hypothetical protein [Sporohalobacter salinus]
MGLSTRQLVQKIDTAVKAITVSDMGKSVLKPEKAARFVRAAQQATPMMNEARYIDMQAAEKDIDKIGFGNRLLKNPDKEELESKPNTDTNTLSAVKVKAIVGIKDDTLEDNIEGEQFEDTLLDMVGDRAGIDMEYLFIQGDTDSSDPFLQLTDGWNKLAANQLKAGNGDFDAKDPESMFKALLHAIPQKYIRRRSDWRYYCSWKTEDDYRDVLKGRGTGLGDRAQTSNERLKYKGIPVVACPNMPQGTCQLTNPDNNAYGIRRKITIEPDRVPKEEKTDFVITARIDDDFEDRDPVAVAEGYTG